MYLASFHSSQQTHVLIRILLRTRFAFNTFVMGCESTRDLSHAHFYRISRRYWKNRLSNFYFIIQPIHEKCESATNMPNKKINFINSLVQINPCLWSTVGHMQTSIFSSFANIYVTHARILIAKCQHNILSTENSRVITFPVWSRLMLSIFIYILLATFFR